MKNDDRRGENRGRSENRGGNEYRSQSRQSSGQGRRSSPRVGAIYSGVPAARRADASDENERPAEYRGNGYRGERQAAYRGNGYRSEHTAENRGNGYRSERSESGAARRNRDFAASEETGHDGARNNRRETAADRTSERGNAGYNRGDASSSRNNRQESASGRTYERGDASYGRGDAGYDRSNSSSSHQSRESNHARRDDAADNFGAARSGEPRLGGASDRIWSSEAQHGSASDHPWSDGERRGGASDRQWSDEPRRGGASDRQGSGEPQREFSETSRESNDPRRPQRDAMLERADRDMMPERSEKYSAPTSASSSEASPERADRDMMPERSEKYSTPISASSVAYTRAPSLPPEENENLLAGRNPIREALKSGRSVEKLLVARGDLSGAARDLIRMAKEAGAVVQEVDRSRLDAIYPAHQGLLAYVAAVDYAGVDDLFARAEERGEPPFFVLLDGVTDPHNLGAILRTAECAGAHGAILPERRSAGLGPAAAKAAAGALDCLPVARVKNLNRTIDELKQRGVWVIGTAMEGEDALSADLSGPVALVIGSEGEGVSRLTLEKCDRTLTLPMRGRIESLNASVAAGILMYEVVRARAK